MPVNIRSLISRSPTKWVRAWLKVLGPPFIALTIVISLLGGAIAFERSGVFDIRLWIFTAVALVFIHFGTSCLNDYFDFLSGTDNINKFPTFFSGGSRVIQEGSLPPKTLLITGSSFIAAGSAIGLYLTFIKGWFIFILGILGVFMAVGYVHPKINLSKRGLGELAVALSFGPIMLSGVYYVQTKMFDLGVALIGVIMGLLAASVLWINEIPDYEADKTVGKTNWVVRIGKKRASRVFVVLVCLIYILTFILLILNILPRFGLIVFLTLIMAVKASRVALKNYEKIEKLLPANALSIAIIITFGLLLSASFLLNGFFLLNF